MTQVTIISGKKVIKIVVLLFLILLTSVLFYWYKIQYQAIWEKSEGIEDNSNLQKTDLLFPEKTYFLSYQDVNPEMVINISLFKSLEKWRGSGFYDDKVFFEYPESLTLAGSDRDVIVAEKEVELDLEKATGIDLAVNLRTDPEELEVASLILTDANLHLSQFTLPRLIKEWNFLDMAKNRFIVEDKFDWRKIRKIRFEFRPRPLGKVVVTLGSLKGERDDLFINNWNTTDKQLVLLDNRTSNISLMMRNMRTYPMVTTLRDVTNATNYSFQTAYTPLTETWSGLFLRGDIQNRYGYYFMVNGLGGNKWQVYKLYKDGIKILGMGIVPNFQFKIGEWYYLKAEAKDTNFNFFLSENNKQFIPLGNITDGEFPSGGVGLTAGAQAVSLFNDFVFTQ